MRKAEIAGKEKSALKKPRKPGEPLKADVVRAMAKQARNNRLYRKLYALQLFMSGEFVELSKMATEQSSSYDTDVDLGLFPDIDPEIGDTGIQNHGLINSRINIQAIVFSSPEFELKIDDPLIREYVQAYLEQIWDEGDFSGKNYEVGMDTECMGFGFAEWGIEDGGVTMEPFSPLDWLGDRSRKSPSSWRYHFIRRRLDLEDAFERFGHLVDYETLEYLAVEMRSSPCESETDERYSAEVYPILPVWSFWHKDTHCLFLGTINGPEDKSILLRMNADLEYEIADDPGPNPFGCLPVSTWVDSWSPGVSRPVGKTETTTRTASMLNKLEWAINTCIDRGIPLTILSTVGLNPATIDKLKNGMTLDQLGEVIISDFDDVSKSVQRLAGLGVPTDYLNVRSIYKDELNASTGVMDSMRGVVMPGERTAQETRVNEANGGIQSKHIRKSYQKFLKQGLTVAIAIGRLWESKRRVVMLSDGPVDTDQFPLRPLLALPLSPSVHEDSLSLTSPDERKQQRMIEFQTVDLKAIEAGVGDPYKIFFQLYRDLGRKDPLTRMKSQDQIAQEQAILAARAAAQGENNNAPNRTSGSGDSPRD